MSGSRPFGALVHVGSVVVDLVLQVPALPTRGGDVASTASTATAGGGFNVMSAAARQGLPVRYAGPHGTGPFGDIARAALAGEGVEVLQPVRPDVDTGLVVTMVDAGGERTFVTSPTALRGPTAQELARVRPVAGETVYLSGYGLLHEPARQALLPWLAALDPDVDVVLDPGPLVADVPEAALRQVLARTDWLSCNAAEARVLTGCADPVEAATALAARTGRRGVVVRTGAQGCLLVEPGATVVRVPGAAVTAVDTTGAGDTHTGVLVAALAEGLVPAEAARRADHAAAFSVGLHGPATGPTADQLARWCAGRGDGGGAPPRPPG